MSSEAGEGTSTSISPTKEQMEIQAQAMNLLAQGKRNLICQEVTAAVQQFQDACQLLAEQFGDMAKECAEAYFHYGSALLDLARMEQGVLGNALDGVDVDADDEGGPDNKEQFESTDKVDGDPSKKEKMEATEEEDEEGEEDVEEGEEKEEGGAGSQESEGADDADDVPNLQLSWEMLELAKIIYSRDLSTESQLRLAETYLKLGEVGLESEQYDQAISDFESCLAVQKQHLQPCDRSIAETYYQLGLACQMSKQLDKAKEAFTAAVECLVAKMEKLKATVEEKPPKNPSQTVEPAESVQREIKEIIEILPEIREKIADTEEESKNMEAIKLMTKQAMGSIFPAETASDLKTETGFGGASSSPDKAAEPAKALDISHLIRKKRKPEEEKQDEEDLENKKQKQEGVSGDASVNGVCEKTDRASSEAVAAT